MCNKKNPVFQENRGKRVERDIRVLHPSPRNVGKWYSFCFLNILSNITKYKYNLITFATGSKTTLKYQRVLERSLKGVLKDRGTVGKECHNSTKMHGFQCLRFVLFIYLYYIFRNDFILIHA